MEKYTSYILGLCTVAFIKRKISIILAKRLLRQKPEHRNSKNFLFWGILEYFHKISGNGNPEACLRVDLR